MSLIIHAPNVHQGGGRSLLLALLQAAVERGRLRAILDARLALPADIPESLVEMRVAPSLRGRLHAELRLRALARAEDTVLCFGNLPPLFASRARVVLFLQNRYLLGTRDLMGLAAMQRLRVLAERVWLRARLDRVRRVVVQSPSMAREVEASLGVAPAVLPFSGAKRFARSAGEHPTGRRIDFLYVASGEPHKNHRNLIEAWSLLARDGLRPSLCLTLDARLAPALCAWIESAVTRHRLRVELTGQLSAERVQALYSEAGALIYPSRFESMGLPLIEARAAGLPIVAAELDYVRDLVDPEESFDPESPTSIGRAVKRFLGVDEPSLALRSPGQFLDDLAAV